MPCNDPGKKIISSLSPHLFWDVDKNKIDLDHDKKMIVQRVMEYGLYKDFQTIRSYYGIKEIGETAMQIKDLDLKTASFISFISKVPQNKFVCYSLKQSIPPHWNF